MNELSHKDTNEVKPQGVESFKSINPEKEMSIKELTNAVRDEFDKASETYDTNETHNQNIHENNNAPEHKECLTTSDERIELAKRSDGNWSGEIGDSTFFPEKTDAKEALKEYNQPGINYKDGEPDFSKVSEATVQIEDMTSNRAYNFGQADTACAKQWNEQNRDGRTNWTPRDVKEWRQENRYSWHERLDMKTMDLVQRDIHDECKHFGGVAECRRNEALGGKFDV